VLRLSHHTKETLREDSTAATEKKLYYSKLIKNYSQVHEEQCNITSCKKGGLLR
jgi:hypothetical protein